MCNLVKKIFASTSLILCVFLALNFSVSIGYGSEIISLAGQWAFRLDPNQVGIEQNWFATTLPEVVKLPGTTDENKKGFKNEEQTTSNLNRIYKYAGRAWYQKEIDIPQSWQDKRITLLLERTKLTKVWVDGNCIGSQKQLSTPHIYDLTSAASVGKHTLTIMVDNTRSLFPAAVTHALAERTQTNWNGIIGRLELTATDKVWIDEVQIVGDIENKTARVNLKIENTTGKKLNGTVTLAAQSKNAPEPEELVKKFNIENGTCRVTLKYPMGKDCQLWDEFSQPLYSMNIGLETRAEDGKTYSDTSATGFGMRHFTTEGTHFAINGRKTFLRGKHDGCVFPLTGYPPMNVQGWERVFKVAQSFGVNYYRFHSWCPPEAAFIAADKMGMYLQPELPFWGRLDQKEQFDYYRNEGELILKMLGNHPSFVMLTLGNEIVGDFKGMAEMVDHFREIDGRHLYALGSNNSWDNPTSNQGGDFWTTSSTYREGGKVVVRIDLVRGSMVHDYIGYINNVYPPSTMTDYTKEIACSDVPVIGHEVGQYLMFPDFGEIKKYTGVLKPYAYEVFRERLKQNHMLDQANDFFKASSQLAAICYREDLEAAMRTEGFGGFAWYDLQDYPGTGTACIGLVDSFMDPKGIVSPAKWRQFCCETAPLLIMPKRTWVSDEDFTAAIKVANFGPKELKSAELICSLRDTSDAELLVQQLAPVNIPTGALTTIGKVKLPLSGIETPQKVIVKLQIKGTEFRNEYDIWVYPSEIKHTISKDLIFTRTLDETTLSQLQGGAKVLVLPDLRDIKRCIKGQFITNFWTVPYFKAIDPPGTLGILCDPDHPLFAHFPTEYHSNWQWWPMTKYSCPVLLDNAPAELRPLVQVIDNYETSRKLGLIFEAAVGKGKVLFCAADLLNHRDKPEVRQLLYSIICYMESEKFEPAVKISADVLTSLFSEQSDAEKNAEADMSLPERTTGAVQID